MNIFLCDEKAEVNIEHDSSICDEYVFHIEVLIRSVFIPYEISYKSFHNEPIFADLLKEVALSIKHILHNKV